MFGVGDVRLEGRGAWLLERIVATGSVVVRRLGRNRAEEVAAHRYLGSPRVTPQGIVETAALRTGAAARGLVVVAAQDTTEIAFSAKNAAGRALGTGSDHKSPAFFIHPVVAVDARDEAVIGLVDAAIWTRSGEELAPRHKRAIADKESGRWLDATEAAAERLAGAAAIVVVADREGDIYSHFAARPAGVDFAVRAHHDRVLAGGGSLFAAPDAWPELARSEVRVAPRGIGDKGRVARVALKAGRVVLNRPRTAEPTDPARLELGLVEAREIDPPQGVAPLLWRIVTTLPIDSAEAAARVVTFYRLRWRIEQVFRALKIDGLGLDQTQMVKAEALFRLAAMALLAAVRIVQLVDARDGTDRPMAEVLDPELIEPAAAIGKSLEGKTQKQINPHRKGTLSWLSWIVARLGGWHCYGKPPGPKTMAIGWDLFAATLAGYLLAATNNPNANV
jgi:hypothetical protein